MQAAVTRYSELLYVQHTAGAGAFEAELRDTFVEALTVNEPPLIQTGRMEDYSPEFWALTAGKGAAVFNMLARQAHEHRAGEHRDGDQKEEGRSGDYRPFVPQRPPAGRLVKPDQDFAYRVMVFRVDPSDK